MKRKELSPISKKRRKIFIAIVWGFLILGIISSLSASEYNGEFSLHRVLNQRTQEPTSIFESILAYIFLCWIISLAPQCALILCVLMPACFILKHWDFNNKNKPVDEYVEDDVDFLFGLIFGHSYIAVLILIIIQISGLFSIPFLW